MVVVDCDHSNPLLTPTASAPLTVFVAFFSVQLVTLLPSWSPTFCGE